MAKGHRTKLVRWSKILEYEGARGAVDRLVRAGVDREKLKTLLMQVASWQSSDLQVDLSKSRRLLKDTEALADSIEQLNVPLGLKHGGFSTILESLRDSGTLFMRDTNEVGRRIDQLSSTMRLYSECIRFHLWARKKVFPKGFRLSSLRAMRLLALVRIQTRRPMYEDVAALLSAVAIARDADCSHVEPETIKKLRKRNPGLFVMCRMELNETLLAAKAKP